MKEVFTKTFWQTVQKTFHEALEDPAAAETTLQTPAQCSDLSANSDVASPSSVKNVSQ